MRAVLLCVVTALPFCCTCQSTLSDDAGVDGGRDAGALAVDAGSDAGAYNGPHVIIDGGALYIDGKPTFLYGGDLHYFRVRAPDYNPQVTSAMWTQTLELMADAGMNLVTTYIPWDYHAPAAGQWDFTGARDFERFLQLACERGFYVIAKPGPLITGEWPRGFGTFGAVPFWWKTAHPEALALKADGKPYSFSLTGVEDQRQPSLLHPTYLAAAHEWYAQVMPRLKPFLKGCLIGLQVDNETNLFWSNHFGDADYHPVALAHFRRWLSQRYTAVAQLNARYGSAYARFEDVPAPTSSPGPSDARKDNPRAADWYWAGQGFVQEYLRTLRADMEAEGFREPDVLYFTNDSPFALTEKDYVLHDTLVHDGRTKNAIGASALDLYPKQDPLSSALQDQPFQADFFTRLYDQEVDLATGPQDWVFAAELQGGFYAFPVVGAPDVKPEATESLLVRSIGRGLKGGAFYVIRDGLNLDDSRYDYRAAIDLVGTPTARFTVMARWGRFLKQYGEDLLFARAVDSRVAVVANSAYAAPQGGVLDEMQRLATIEQPAVMGWLVSAGISPEVLDLQLTSTAKLNTYKVVFYLNPDFQDDVSARKLTSYANSGGVLVTSLWPGRVSEAFVATQASAALSALYPATDKSYWQWKGTNRRGEVNVARRLPGGADTVTSAWYASFWKPSGAFTPLLYERTAIIGTNGDVVGWSATSGSRTSVFLGTYLATRFNQAGYYSLPDDELLASNELARAIVQLGDEQPMLVTGHGRHLAWARRSPRRLYVFLLNDTASAAPIHLRFAQLAPLGLDRVRTYQVTEGLTQSLEVTATGASLETMGLDVSVPPLRGAVLVLDAR